MRTKLLKDGPEKVFVLVFDKGDEVMAGLKRFVAGRHLSGAAHLTAIGAFERARLGFFDRGHEDYKPIEVPQQAEVLSLVGNLAPDPHDPGLHVHVVLGLADGSTRGGHLFEAVAWPTLEMVVTEEPGHMRRRKDPETGLALPDVGS